MPLGLKAVTNPIPATGAQDPECLDNARVNAPLTVLTLDRVVSLQDYEDFARAFAGIAKALATWTWDGEKRGVFVTVAGPDGAEIRSDSAVYANLLAAMRNAGDPHVPIRIKSYRSVTFRLAGRIKTLAEYRREKVLEEVETALRSDFSFDARAFGQPVNLSEVVGLIHSVDGVLAVFIDEMYRVEKAIRKRQPGPNQMIETGERYNPFIDAVIVPAEYRLDVEDERSGRYNRIEMWWRKHSAVRVTDFEAHLEAAVPQAGEATVMAAELLTLDPGPLGLEVES